MKIANYPLIINTLFFVLAASSSISNATELSCIRPPASSGGPDDTFIVNYDTETLNSFSSFTLFFNTAFSDALGLTSIDEISAVTIVESKCITNSVEPKFVRCIAKGQWRALDFSKQETAKFYGELTLSSTSDQFGIRTHLSVLQNGKNFYLGGRIFKPKECINKLK